jgi:hypothetical protein
LEFIFLWSKLKPREKTMDDRRFSSDELKSIGTRMRTARTLTGLNQEEFSKKYDFSHTSIKNWEVGRVIPRVNGIDHFIRALSTERVTATRDWILYGMGSLSHSDTVHKGPVAEEGTWDPDVTAEAELFKNNCAAKGALPIIAIVRDHLMAPLFCLGDVVGGHDFKGDIPSQYRVTMRVSERPLLFKTHDNSYVARFALFDGKRWLVKNNVDSAFETSELPPQAGILWHRSAKLH